MSADEKLNKFVRRATTKSAGYSRLCLVQVLASGGSNILRNYELNAEYGYDSSKCAEIVAELMVTAQEDADGHSGVSTYCIKALAGVTLGERSPHFKLRSQDADDSEALGDTEPATKDGHLAQLMRHNEVLMRMNVQQSEVMSNQASNVIARLTERLNHYEDKHLETIIQLEEMANLRDERETVKMKELGKEKRLDEALKTFKPLVPVVIAKLRGIPAEAKTELHFEALKEVLKNVKPDQMQQIAEILGPQSLALATIYMDAHKEGDSDDEQESTSAKADS